MAEGTLYIVATPIGNLQDVSLRALQVLQSVDVIACEDTRHTRRLLDRHGIQAQTRSLHKFNEARRAEQILALLSAGKSVALVSDAGTPAISDPGAELVKRVAAAGHVVTPIPGPAAPIALLSVAGLREGPFLFLGFLPGRAGERGRMLDALAGREETLVFLEAPTRIVATLVDLVQRWGPGRRAVIGREMTKRHEEVLRGELGELAERVAAGTPRGEYTVAVEGSRREPATLPPGTIAEQVRLAQERLGLDRKEAMRYVARERGLSRRDIYRSLLAEEETDPGAEDGDR